MLTGYVKYYFVRIGKQQAMEQKNINTCNVLKIQLLNLNFHVQVL
jgi:hypothetical protein